MTKWVYTFGDGKAEGGAGKDFFVVHRRDAGTDTISNFEASRGEIVDLAGVYAADVSSGCLASGVGGQSGG